MQMTRSGTPTELSLSQAARLTGKSKSTINRAIKSGKLSATRHDDGTYSINAAELARGFQISTPYGSEWIDTEPKSHPNRTALLEAEIAALKAAREQDREIIADLREDRDAWKQQATALLAAPSKHRRWWPF
jgi:excisionase family DNA binding protein